MMMSKKDRETISALASLLYKQEASIVGGKTKLSLTTNCLTVLSAGFLKLSDVECVENSRVVIASSPMLMELQFLRQCMKKLPAIKVIHGTSTIQGRVDLTSLVSLRHLEVKKAPIHLLEGLHVARANLLSITCSRCLQNLQDVFVSCGGDMSSAEVWPALKAACLSSNNIETLDESLRYLPVLEYLDLSYNHLVNTQHFLESLSELEHLHLGYNKLYRVPSLSPAVCAKLRSLILRNNNLDNIDGVEHLTSLRELDVCENCLAEHAKLAGLVNLHHIKSVNLVGNPLYYHVNHRPLTLQYLSPLAVRDRGKVKHVLLDGKLISDSDKQYVPKEPAYFEATSSGGYENRPSTSRDESFDSIHQKVEAQIHHLHPDSARRRARDLPDNDSLTDSDLNRSFTRKGRRKPRKVLITDLESSTDFENSTSREPSRGTSPAKLSSSLADRAEYEAARKQLGPDWLVTVNERYFQANQRSPSSSTSQQPGAPANKKGGEVMTSERLSENLNGPFGFVGSPMDLESGVQFGGEKSEVLVERSVSEDAHKVEWSWSHESKEDEAVDGEPFIVTRGDGCQMMALLGDHFLWETNLNNQVLEKFDLRSLREAEQEGSSRVRLSFDTLRSDRKHRVYTMEDSKHAQEFVALLSPRLVTADRGSGGPAMHCMKCDTKFTDNTKTGSVSCPNCGGSIVIQLEDPHARQQLDDFVGSFKSLDGRLTPLACSSAQPSPAKASTDSGDNTSFRSVDDTDTAASVQSGTSFKSVDDTDLSESSFQASSFPNSESQASFHTIQSDSTYRTADDRTIGSNQSEVSLDNSQTSLNNSVSVINGFKIQYEESGDATPKPSQKSRTQLDFSKSERNQVQAVSSCPGFKPLPRAAQHDHLNQRSRMDSEDSDITIISNPSVSSITVLPNPSRETRGQSNGPVVNQNLSVSPKPRSLSLDEGRTLSEILGTKTEEVVTDRENKALISPCGSLTTKTVSSMIDSMYERNISPNSTSETLNISHEEIERTERLETTRTETMESARFLMTSQSPGVTSPGGFVYNYEDYSSVDHRIKLWLAMSVLEKNEELLLLLRCDVCRFGKENLTPCLFVVTNTRIHFYKIIAPERGQPADWLMVLACFPKPSVRYVDTGYSYQWFQIEIQQDLFSLVVRDEGRCKRFLTAFTAALEDASLSTRSDLRGITKNQASTMEALQDLCDAEADESVVKRLFACHAVRGKGDSLAVTVVITAERLYLTVQNYEWPAPRAFSQSATSKRPQFDVINQRQINEVSCLNLYEDAPLSIIISFFSEDITAAGHSDWSASWMVTMATPSALSSLVEAVRTPWEAEFGVELQVLRKSVSPKREVTP